MRHLDELDQVGEDHDFGDILKGWAEDAGVTVSCDKFANFMTIWDDPLT